MSESTGKHAVEELNTSSCPVCSSLKVSEFVRRNHVPVHQNLLMVDRQEAIGIRRGDLQLYVCSECGFVFNHAFDEKKIMYGEEYDNTQSHSPAFSQHMDELVRHLVVDREVRDSHVIEVGCGKGLFLRKLVEYKGGCNKGHGFDPSYVGDDSPTGELKFERRYYDADCAGVPADVVISRHVIEHVRDPLNLLRNIRAALSNSLDARLFLETPCVRWILRNKVIWDFFYEHCSYFTAESLATATQIAGFVVEDVRTVFGDQYLWLEARVSASVPEVTRGPGDVSDLAAEFGRTEHELVEGWKSHIRDLRAKGKIALWGAGAKGVTFANLIDPACESIACVVDLNPAKQGRFVPGTGHPIVDYRDLADYGVTTALIMNPNYREENLALVREAGLGVTLI